MARLSRGPLLPLPRLNIWPRPIQQPHPPVWVSTTSPGGARASRRARLRSSDVPHRFRRHAKRIFNGYRSGWREAGRGQDVPIDRLAYAALVYVAPRKRRAPAPKSCCGTSPRTRCRRTLPTRRAMCRFGQRRRCAAPSIVSGFKNNASVQGAIEAGLMLPGTPDQVLAVQEDLRLCRRLRPSPDHGTGRIPRA